jgi:hypothetical protein
VGNKAWKKLTPKPVTQCPKPEISNPEKPYICQSRLKRRTINSICK